MAQSCVYSRLSLEKEDASTCIEHREVHVLAVDDNMLERKMIEKLLKITSCKVTAVDSGSRALQFLGLDKEEITPLAFDGLKVDLIITDYCMPGMTGYELLKKIKGSSSFREIPVVIMSSENILTRIDRCLEEGAEDFIVKPVKLSDVERLKSSMFGDGRIQRKDGVFNEPTSQVDPCVSPLSNRLLSTTSPPSDNHVSIDLSALLASSTPSSPLTPSSNYSPLSISPSPPFPSSESSIHSTSNEKLSTPNNVVPNPSSPPNTKLTSDDMSLSSSSSPRQFPSFASRQHMPFSPTSRQSPTRRIELISHD